MLVRSYHEVHSPHTNAKLINICKEIGRKNYWIGSGDPPHNMVEEYIQQWHSAFLTGEYIGIEYWVYQSEKGNTFDGFHFDKDEMDPQIEHPKWCGCVNLTYDFGATCISDMTYGNIKPKECIFSYGDEAKTLLWDGNLAWADLAGEDDCRLYINVWTKRKPRGLIRSKEIPYPRQHYITGMYKKDKVIPYTGSYLCHTHICGDMFDEFVLREPDERQAGCTYLVTDATLS